MPVSPPFLAIVGCGFIFRSVYAPILETLADRARVIALVDPSPDAAREAAVRFPGSQTLADIDALLASPAKPDAAMVLTPERFNAPATLRLLQAGIPVYLEKPPAIRTQELLRLIEAETSLGVPVYTAFNRRHTPLLRDWRPPSNLRAVRGLLSRQGRAVENFPYTGSHLLDTSQYFSGSPFAETRVRFDTASGSARWTVEGRLENQAALELVFLPDRGVIEETLVFETDDGEWTIHFPNARAALPQGRVVFKTRDGVIRHDTSGRPGLPWQTDQGFPDVLQDFLHRLVADTLAETPHRLPRCLPATGVMERMMEARLQPA